MIKNTTQPVEIVVIADRSGSMSSIKDDAIGGFNQFLKEQQELGDYVNLTLVLFDGQYEVPIKAEKITEVTELNSNTYVPRGMTALNDAIGKTLSMLNKSNPEKAIVCILTDGMENCSSEYTTDKIKSQIEEIKGRGWEVIYLAANQDAFSEGGARGISTTKNFAATGVGVRSAYDSASTLTTNYRNG